MSRTKRFFTGCAASILLGACWDVGTSDQAGGDVSRSWNPAELREVRDIPVETLRTEIDRQLKSRLGHLTEDQWGHVRRLYQKYQNSPLWMDDDGLLRKRAETMVDALVNATADGINIENYPLVDLAYSLDTLKRVRRPTAQQIARADVLLTASFTALGEDYLTGQVDPRSVSQSWHINRREERIDSALARSILDRNLADAIGRMRPEDHLYEMLRRTLGDYRKIVQAGGWQPVPAGKALKRGDTDSPARLAALRARLQVEGIRPDVEQSQNGERASDDAQPNAAAANVYDASLAALVAEFQERHAIGVDSVLGHETIESLNVPAEFRLAQIAANLERYRWLPRALGDRYIFVNVAAFRLNAYDAGRKVLEMKVIVGAEYQGRATPVFSDSMQFVVFRPYWVPTDNIAQNELFPQFDRTGVPASYEVYNEGGKRKIRQTPGPKNALGLVKFMFPNDFAIYLHDTPQQALFDKDVRAFSHGCIRVQKPVELAQWVLGWSEDRVRQAMQGSNNRHVNLPKNIPVYIAYFTAYMRDGELWFGNDLYSRDDALVKAVWGGAVPSPRAVRAIEVLRNLTD